jgi:DNA-binding NarL/FixJ family response regulator
MQGLTVGIYDEYMLMQQSVCALLSDISAITINLTCNDVQKLQPELKATPVNVLIISIHAFDNSVVDLIKRLNFSFPNTRILVMSFQNSEEIILKTIKAGAKGFLSKHANKNELVEAIFTLRSGYDYYSAPITQLLLNKYINKIKSDDKETESTIKSLSSRQIEILRLWGEGYANQDIADKLFISIRTVESHKNHIMQKLNLKTTVDMVKFAIKNNLIGI